MSDDVFSTTLAYTKSPKLCRRTTLQEELIEAIAARLARLKSSECSENCAGGESVSLADVSDTSVDENSVEKTLNDFQISDNEEKNSANLSFLKNKKLYSDMMEDEPSCSTMNNEEKAPDGCEDVVVNPLSEFQNEDQEIEKEKIKMKPKPRILPVKSTSSAENHSSLEADSHFTPSPLPRSILKKHGHGEEKDGLGEEKGTALCKDLEAHPAPLPLPRLNGRQLGAEREAFPEHLEPENPWLTSLSSSLNESLGNSDSPGSGEKTFIKDGKNGNAEILGNIPKNGDLVLLLCLKIEQNEEFTEKHNSLKSNENQENSFLIDFINTALEKSKESQMTTDELEEENKKVKLIMSDDLTVDPPLLKSQSMLIPTNATESAKKTNEDRIMKNKKSTNNRASSASSRLMTFEFLKNSSSIERTPLKTTSSRYMRLLTVLYQKPSQKQYLEPDRADDIRAAAYQEWLEKKNIYLQEKNRIKRIETEKLRIQNEQKKAAKREAALALFEAWKAMKEKEAKKIAAQKSLEDKNNKKPKEENAARKVEAQQAFERWREKKKIEYLKEKNKKEKEYERAKKQKEEDTVAEQRKDNGTAVEKWNEEKEAFFKEKEKDQTDEKRTEVKRAEKIDKDKQAINEYEKCLNPWLTSLSSFLNESLGNSFSPGSGEKTFIKDQNEEFTENRNSLKSNENQENSFLIDFINTALEKSKESQMTTDELEEEKETAKMNMSDDLTVDPPLLKSQSMLIPTNATESAKKTIEDRIMKNKKSTNNRASSASSRLTTSEFLKNSSSLKRTPPKTTSSLYLWSLTALDQKPSQKQYLEPDRADDIRAAVYQEWLEKKNIYLQEKNRIKRIETEKLRIQNEQKKAAKREAALASFEAWKAMKEKEAKKIAAQKSLEDKNKKKPKEENTARKVEAQQAFERWREKKKIEYLKEKNKKEKEYERAKKQKEEETVAEQRKDNGTAVEKWNEEKEAFFKEKEKDQTDEKRTEVKRAEKIDKDKQAINEYEKCLNPWLTSLSSSQYESLGNSYSPGSGEKPFIKDQNEEFTENRNTLKSNENQKNLFLITFNTALEKSKESQMTTDELEEEKEKANLIMSDDLTVDPPLLKSQSMLIPTNATESTKKTIEDRIMNNKKSTNNRASSASSRLRTSEFLKNSSSIKRTPLKTTSSQYLWPFTVLDQKPSQKQYLEPDRADEIRAAVYQEWLEKKNIYLQEKNRIKRIETEKLRIQNEQEKAAKREAALASFEAWKAMKEKEAKKIAAQKSLEDKNNKKTEEENAARKVEAQQAFERWREKKKIGYLKEKNKKEKEYERAKKQKEEETVAEQRKDNGTAVEKWNEEKEAFFKEKEKDQTDEKRTEVKRAEKIDKDKQAINEYEKCLNPWITSLSSSQYESLGNSYSPGSGEKPFIKDQNEEFTENRNSLKSNENQENSFLIDFINTALEKSKESQMTTDELEEDKEKAKMNMSDDLTVDPPLLKSQSMLIPSNATESAKEWLENKKIYLQEKNGIKGIDSEKLRIQNEQKKAAKREAALASFEAWKAMKEKDAKKIATQKSLEDKNNKKAEEENAARKVEAQQGFERWREKKKVEYLKEKNKKEKEYERAKKQKEEETVAEQRKDNGTAVEKWNEEKEAFFKEKEKDQTDEKRTEVKRAEKIDKDKQAINEYEKCLEKKGRQVRIKQKQKKHHSFLENEALPPWSPPSRIVFLKRVLIILILILFLLFCY